MPVATCHVEDRAVVLGDAIGASVERGEVREVPVLVEDAGQLGDTFGEAAAGEARARALDAALPPALEDVVEQRGISVRDV